MVQNIKLAVLTDIHFTGPDTPASSCKGRVSKLADRVLSCAVRRINEKIKPDATLVLGDLVDNGCANDLRATQKIISKTESPLLLVPGNHDGDVAAFDQIFGSLPQSLDIRGYRLVALRDPEQPGYNAVRTENGFAQMRAARSGFSGPIIAVQHVPVFPAGKLDLLYNYTNWAAVIACMREEKIGWVIAGHAHRSADYRDENGLHFIAAPALCERPFQFVEIDIDEKGTRITPHSLQDEPEYAQWQNEEAEH